MSSWFDEQGFNADDDARRDHRYRGSESGPTVPAPQPSAQTLDEIKAKMRAGGVSEHVVNDEAASIMRYGSDVDRVIGESMGGWLARSAPGTGGGGSAAAPAAVGLSGGFATGAPQAISPYTKQFQAPTMEQVQLSPGFQFRLGEGMKALQRSAAARGTLLTGGTAKAINAFGQDFASNEYDKAYGRAIGEHQQDFGQHQWNEGNRFTSQRTNRMDDFGIFDSNRNFGQGADRFAFEKDQALWGRKNLETDQDFQRRFRFADYGFNSARNNPAY
jgi:hypothetical protein